MGCGSSKAVSVASPASTTNTSTTIAIQQVKQTWPDVKKIDKLAEKTFAYLLYKYPEFKPFYNVPEAYRTEADLLDADETKEPSQQFLALYSNIIEKSDKKFDEVIKEKATQLYNKGIRTSQIKYYSDSLVHVIKYELKDLTVEEKQAWQLFSTHVSNQLAIEIAKFPRKSIFDR